LSGLLAEMPSTESPDLIVGMDTLDDAGVFRISESVALVQTVDFFAPVVNDPVSCGRIIAANCLSDVWAMGGRPVTAMNLLGFPSAKIPVGVIAHLLKGAGEKLVEAGVVLVGGHSVDQSTVIFGMSVTGLIEPGKAIRNSMAREGDAIILTKPLGSGILASELKEGRILESSMRSAVKWMERLNMYACRVLSGFEVSAMTDITGFGLLGHSLAMARFAEKTIEFDASSIPLYDGALASAARYIPGGSGHNFDYAAASVETCGDVREDLLAVLYDAQASGGLLAAVEAGSAGEAVKRLRACGDEHAAVVGRVLARGSRPIRLVG
jgi:selenide,water dikinase